LIKGAEDETNLRGELIEIHGGEAYIRVYFCDSFAAFAG